MIFNLVAEPRNGLDFCSCGAKYWYGYRCASCDKVYDKLIDQHHLTDLDLSLAEIVDAVGVRFADDHDKCVKCGVTVPRGSSWSMLLVLDGWEGRPRALTIDSTKEMIKGCNAQWVTLGDECARTVAPPNFRIMTKFKH